MSISEEKKLQQIDIPANMSLAKESKQKIKS
jgi:hypothetical protein